MSRTVVITGAAGSIGRKLRAHMEGLGWTLRLYDLVDDGVVEVSDLLDDGGAWTRGVEGADAVIHLAAHPWPPGSWTEARMNMDMTANVLRVARQRGAGRVVLASSHWIMAGYRFAGKRITPDMEPAPLHPYGVSKLAGERMGRDAAAQGLSVIALRIGWNQPTPGNVPGPHMVMGTYGQQIWLSDGDLCHGFERAVLVEGVDFAVLNLMSDNPGMMFDLAETRRTIGYAPRDGWTAVVDDDKRRGDEMARRCRELAAALELQVMDCGW
jgi:NAD+ dependent glucose-6-phosphate dehydrogenase